MNAPATHPALTALESELVALEAVHAALEEEYSALVDSQAERLENAVADKARLLDALVERRRERESLTGTGSLRDYVSQQMAGNTALLTTATTLIDKLQAIGDECKKINVRNGQLIGGLREMTSGALGILRGEPVVTLYGQSGDSACDLGSRSLGTA